MDTGELTRVFQAATAQIVPRPGFTAAVVRGGVRRRNRNRARLAGGLTVATALLGAGVHALRPVPEQELQFADPRWSRPTRGDLASDQEFLASAVSAWRAGAPFGDLRGQPRVYWAGTTPAGPAAIVVQQAYLRPQDPVSPIDTDQFASVLGLVERDSGALRLAASTYRPASDANATTLAAFLFGTGDRTILIVEAGVPLFVSSAPVDTLDGRLTRQWTRIPATDGVASAAVPDGVAPSQVLVLARPTRPSPDDKTMTGLVSLTSEYQDPRPPSGLPLWQGPDARVTRRVGAASTIGAPIAGFAQALEKGGATDLRGVGVLPDQWSVTAGLPDGRTAIVSERCLELYPTRLFLALFNPDGTFQRLVPEAIPTASATLPVHIHLPDGQGWLVANYGATLKFRSTPTESWQPAGPDAALLPDTATTVQVTKNGITSEVGLLK